jgi:hypothetical protein
MNDSNGGYVLAVALAEKLSGLSFDRLLVGSPVTFTANVAAANQHAAARGTFDRCGLLADGAHRASAGAVKTP